MPSSALRIRSWVPSVDPVSGVLVEDRLGICAELEAQMERHVAACRDERRGVLDDPEALARFGPSVALPVRLDDVRTARG